MIKYIVCRQTINRLRRKILCRWIPDNSYSYVVVQVIATSEIWIYSLTMGKFPEILWRADEVQHLLTGIMTCCDTWELHFITVFGLWPVTSPGGGVLENVWRVTLRLTFSQQVAMTEKCHWPVSSESKLKFASLTSYLG